MELRKASQGDSLGFFFWRASRDAIHLLGHSVYLTKTQGLNSPGVEWYGAPRWYHMSSQCKDIWYMLKFPWCNMINAIHIWYLDPVDIASPVLQPFIFQWPSWLLRLFVGKPSGCPGKKICYDNASHGGHLHRFILQAAMVALPWSQEEAFLLTLPTTYEHLCKGCEWWTALFCNHLPWVVSLPFVATCEVNVPLL